MCSSCFSLSSFLLVVEIKPEKHQYKIIRFICHKAVYTACSYFYLYTNCWRSHLQANRLLDKKHGFCVDNSSDSAPSYTFSSRILNTLTNVNELCCNSLSEPSVLPFTGTTIQYITSYCCFTWKLIAGTMVANTTSSLSFETQKRVIVAHQMLGINACL